MLKDFLENASPKAKLIALSIPTFFLLVIVISIISMINSSPKKFNTPLAITNFSQELPNIPNQYQTDIEQYIWSTIKDKDIDESSKIDAIIRNNSIKLNGERYTFLVDAESLHYTFRVSLSWSEELTKKKFFDPGYYVECPKKEEVIYADTKCPIGTPLEQLKAYLPIIGTTPSGATYSATIETYGVYREHPKEKYLSVLVNACGDKKLLAEGETEIHKKIRTYNVDPNDLYIEIKNQCHDTTTENKK